MHGKTDRISHDNRGLFAGLPNPFVATRYHSLVIHPDTVPEGLEVSAWVEDYNGDRRSWVFDIDRFPSKDGNSTGELSDGTGPELLRRFLYWKG